MATLGGHLPEESMMEILTRLPPVSLCQYNHLLLKRLVNTDSGGKKLMFSTLKFPIALDRPVSVLDVNLPFEDYIEFIGHSHGLVCFTDGCDIFLTNPTTREFRKLPPSIIFIEAPHEPDGYNSFSRAVGFGYDAKSKDFKVVRVVGFAEGAGQFYPSRVEIYDLSKDRWREMERTVCAEVFALPSFEMYHKGTYYWLGLKGNDSIDIEVIHTFDISKEVFGEILLPESFQLKLWNKNRSMRVLNGSIVLFLHPFEPNDKFFDIWGMKKYECCVVSWSKLLTIDPVSGIQIDKPLSFVSSDELVMVLSESGQLILYNIKTQHIKELPIRGGDPESFEATFFVESFMSMKGENNNISYEF